MYITVKEKKRQKNKKKKMVTEKMDDKSIYHDMVTGF